MLLLQDYSVWPYIHTLPVLTQLVAKANFLFYLRFYHGGSTHHHATWLIHIHHFWPVVKELSHTEGEFKAEFIFPTQAFFPRICRSLDAKTTSSIEKNGGCNNWTLTCLIQGRGVNSIIISWYFLRYEKGKTYRQCIFESSSQLYGKAHFVIIIIKRPYTILYIWNLFFVLQDWSLLVIFHLHWLPFRSLHNCSIFSKLRHVCYNAIFNWFNQPSSVDGVCRL